MGARWRIGSGISIPVLNQSWLPSKDNPYVSSSHEALRHCIVFNLLQVGNMCWDEEVLEDLFESRDVDLIGNIPLPLTPNMDSWYWAFEDYGSYSVKSAYRALQVLNGRWNSQDNSDVETTFHIMVTCPFTMACLERGLGITVMIGEVEFGSWFESFYNAHPEDGIDKLTMILWGVWGARNDLLWNKKIASVERVVSAAVTYLELWKVAQLKNGDVSASTSHASIGSELWSKPSLVELKVNCDAAIFSREKSHGLGWIARDSAGVLLTAAAEKRNGGVDPVVAGAMLMKEDLSWLKQTWGNSGSFEGWVPAGVRLETDCLVLVNAINNTRQILSPLGLIVSNCIGLIRSLSMFHFSIQFVKQSGNQAANWLARSSGSCPDRLSCRGSIPIGLEAILLAGMH
uniref:RNase H type-1 domain-containing protein n=1 Tax=Cannabis sativa TaxID=3483 RepID=A0A803Q767_CANSA